MSFLLVPLLLAAGDSGVHTRFAVEPGRVEVGQPFALVVEVEHPSGHAPALPVAPAASPAEAPAPTGPADIADAEENADAPPGAGAEPLDGSWVLLATRLEPEAALADRPGRSVTRRVFELVSLEPGARALPSAFVQALVPPESDVLSGSAVSIDVAGVLAEGEDAPRPLRGLPASFGAAAAPAADTSPRLWALGAALVIATIGGLLLRHALRHGRARRAAPPEPSPAERLERLAAEPLRDPADARERHFALTDLLRAAGDERSGQVRAGLTDEEWLARLEREHALSAAARGSLGEVLARCAAVKYGAARPTEWALQETVAAAKRALEALQAPAGAQAATLAGGGA